MPKRKKIVKRRKVPKKQKGGAKKKTTHCVCSKKHHQMGGKFLSPAQMKMLTRPVRRFSTLPVNPKLRQQGMGHCGGRCGQCGGDFLGIGKAFKKIGKSIVSNPLRLAAAIGTMGMSESFLTPMQLVGDATGIKPSKVLNVAAPIIGAVGTAAGAPELGLGSKFTAIGLKQMGLGYQPMLK
tara:strand:- start:66 stop:608 length:543 start_codon:yes stop_codon:yes gene_type:complete